MSQNMFGQSVTNYHCICIFAEAGFHTQSPNMITGTQSWTALSCNHIYSSYKCKCRSAGAMGGH